jgi:hypothetical protein
MLHTPVSTAFDRVSARGSEQEVLCLRFFLMYGSGAWLRPFYS